MALCAFFSWAGGLSQSHLLPHAGAQEALRAQEPVPEPEPGGVYAELSGGTCALLVLPRNHPTDPWNVSDEISTLH